MSHPSSVPDQPVTPAQVWTRLAADYQARAIRLLAQLAFNLLAAQADAPVQEAHYAVATDHA
ncbi:MAG: hypothetical protein KKA73_31105 [Chloroflexi bacterium]|nr:hypothetical protein [Chloroflexota bacterium]